MQRHPQRQSQGDCCVQQGTHGEPIVLVVENSPGTRCWLSSVMSQAFPNGAVFSAASVHTSLAVLAVQPVDIAVVDLDMPDGAGIEVVQECFRMTPLTRCVVTTVHDDDRHLASALAAGALGFLLKDQPEAVLIQQLRLLAEGIAPLAPSVARRLLRQFMAHTAAAGREASHVDSQDDLVRLSGREKQVLSLIAKGMQIAAVAQLLEITTNTVCSHIKSIYRKRHLSSRAEAALEAKRLGLV